MHYPGLLYPLFPMLSKIEKPSLCLDLMFTFQSEQLLCFVSIQQRRFHIQTDTHGHQGLQPLFHLS